MKIIEVSFDKVKRNLKNNVKLMIVILIACIVIGIIAGIVSSNSYDATKNVSTTQIEEKLNFSDLEKNEEYYYTAFYLLKEKRDYIAAYLEYFDQVDLSTGSREKLLLVQNRLNDYEAEFTEAMIFFKKNPPALYEERAQTIKFYNKKIEELKEKEAELKGVMAGTYTDDYMERKQRELTHIQMNMEMLSAHINVLNTATPEVLQEHAAGADAMLIKNESDLNEIVDLFNETMKEISKAENYEIIYNKRLINEYFVKAGFSADLDKEDILYNQKYKAIIYARSISGLDIKRERFCAMFTFFCLVGVAISVILGAFYKKNES